MKAQLRYGTMILLAAGMACVSTGCDQKDAEKCREGQEGVRASLKADDQQKLQEFREYAFEYCEEGEFAALDREIKEAREAEKQAEAEKKRKQQENEQLLQVFLKWVGDTKGAPEKAAAAQCQGDEEAEKEEERWCTGDRMAGSHRFEVTYWEKEPAAVVYKTTVPHPITCDAIGPHTVVKSGTVQGGIKRHHCQITGGPASGMQALVTEARNAPLEIFSARFVELHAGLKKKLQAL